MSNLYKVEPKAKLSHGNTSVTVYGEAARAIEGIVISTVALLALALIVKALK